MSETQGFIRLSALDISSLSQNALCEIPRIAMADLFSAGLSDSLGVANVFFSPKDVTSRTGPLSLLHGVIRGTKRELSVDWVSAVHLCNAPLGESDTFDGTDITDPDHLTIIQDEVRLLIRGFAKAAVDEVASFLFSFPGLRLVEQRYIRHAPHPTMNGILGVALNHARLDSLKPYMGPRPPVVFTAPSEFKIRPFSELVELRARTRA